MSLSIETTPKITPFLWFDDRAMEAARFYTSIFQNSSIDGGIDSNETLPGPPTEQLSVNFTLDGVRFIALNGGPQFAFSKAISFFVRCETQAEVDHFWTKLSEGGETLPCGWLTDKFGVTWQIVPSILGDLLTDDDAEKVERVSAAMLRMTKLDIAALQAAADGSTT